MQYLRKTFISGFIASITLVFLASPAIASRTGIERPNNTFAVGITFKSDGIDRVCSGALIAPTIVVTAGHCVYDSQGNIGSDYYFTAPGVALDAPINPTSKPIKLLKVFSKPGFSVNTSGLPDDIAFLQLDAPLSKTGFIRVATTAEVSKLADNEIAKGYGFGAVPELNMGYSVYAREYHIHWNAPKIFPASTIHLNSDIASACTGDSGGPITTVLPTGEEVLLAVMSGAARVINECGTVDAQGNYTMQATVVDSYMHLINEIIKPAIPVTISKRYKITCVKGKIKKYVTGVNPKCPTGYKQISKTLVKSL